MQVSPDSDASELGSETTAELLAYARADFSRFDEVTPAAARVAFDTLAAMAAAEPTVTTAMERQRAGTLDRTALLAQAVNADDRDDLHWPSLTHPGSVVWPAFLGASSPTTSLETPLDAGRLGYQVTVGVAALLGPRHRQAFHVTTTAATLGTTTAAGVVLALDDAALGRAVRHAASMLGGTSRAVREGEGSATGTFHRVVAALTVAAAAEGNDLAPAVTRPLDGQAGFADATGLPLSEIEPDIDVAVTATTIRRHLVCGFAHTLVDAILELPQLDPSTVTRVEARVPELALAATEPPAREPPERPRWHLPHAAASALIGPNARVTALPVEDQGARALRRRIDIVFRPAATDDLHVDLRIELRGSDPLTVTRHYPVGHPACPLDDEALLPKAGQRGLSAAGPLCSPIRRTRDGDRHGGRAASGWTRTRFQTHRALRMRWRRTECCSRWCALTLHRGLRYSPR